MDATLQMEVEWFTNVLNGPSATQLILPISLGLTKSATLTMEEVDSMAVATGRYMLGNVAAISSGQFYNLAKSLNQYYLNPINMAPWIDYSSSSTITGWSSTTTKRIYYRVIDGFVYFDIIIQGTSNANTATFTLPLPLVIKGSNYIGSVACQNNGVYAMDTGTLQWIAASSHFRCFRDNAGTAWTTSGQKTVQLTGYYPYE